jgi:hypothetical protein
MSSDTKVTVGAKVRSVRLPQFRRVGITFTSDEERIVKLDEISVEQLDYLLESLPRDLVVEPIYGEQSERDSLIASRGTGDKAYRKLGKKTTQLAVTGRRLKVFTRCGIAFELRKTRIVEVSTLTPEQAEYLLNSDDRDLVVVELSGKQRDTGVIVADKKE